MSGMIVTESELRELWRSGRQALPAFPPGTRFSQAAQDFLKTHQLEIRFEDPAAAPADGAETRPAWDKPAVFPVVLSGPALVCAVCGQPLSPKPDHMTQLDAGRFAPKTHPRIRFRGQLDSLHAVVMLTAAEARRYHLPRLAAALDSLAAYCREVQSAEYHGRPVQPLSLLGRDEAELHQTSHWPDRHLGIAHLTLEPADHAILHWLNLARTQARELELSALELYGPKEHTHSDQDASGSIPHALNRLSSAIYVTALLFKRGDLAWQV
jgi:ethanolamine utilization cobalamin adenosyltransferase